MKRKRETEDQKKEEELPEGETVDIERIQEGNKIIYNGCGPKKLWELYQQQQCKQNQQDIMEPTYTIGNLSNYIHKLGTEFHEGVCENPSIVCIPIPPLEKLAGRGWFPIDREIIDSSMNICIVECEWDCGNVNGKYDTINKEKKTPFIRFTHLKTINHSNLTSMILPKINPLHKKIQGFIQFGITQYSEFMSDKTIALSVTKLKKLIEDEDEERESGDASQENTSQNSNKTSQRKISKKNIDYNNIKDYTVDHARQRSSFQVFRELYPCINHALKNRIVPFSFDLGTKGAKRFLACTYDEAFRLVFLGDNRGNDEVSHQSLYELLLENRPILPFFDMEFNPQLNPEKVDMLDKMTETVMTFITTAFKIYLKKVVSPDSWIVLDATDVTRKCSRHLIIRQNDIIFDNLISLQNFMKSVHEYFNICKDSGSNTQESVSNLLVDAKIKSVTGNEQKTEETIIIKQSFIDFGVYGKNRAFRTYGSTKLGERRFLKLYTPLSTHKSTKQYQVGTKLLFFNTLVTWIEDHSLNYQKYISYHVTKPKTRSGSDNNEIQSSSSSSTRLVKAIEFQMTDNLSDFLCKNTHLSDWENITLREVASSTGDIVGSLVTDKKSMICALQTNEGKPIYHSKPGNCFVVLYSSGKAKGFCHSTTCKEIGKNPMWTVPQNILEQIFTQ